MSTQDRMAADHVAASDLSSFVARLFAATGLAAGAASRSTENVARGSGN